MKYHYFWNIYKNVLKYTEATINRYSRVLINASYLELFLKMSSANISQITANLE